MNSRERFKAVMSFGNFDRISSLEIGTWPQTLERWYGEGLSQEAIHGRIFIFAEDSCFGFESHRYIDVNIRQPYPFKEIEILEEDGRHFVFIDQFGIKRRGLREGELDSVRMSMDEYLEYPVKDRRSFEAWKKHFIGNFDKRYPPDYEEKKAVWESRDYPLCLTGSGQLGFYSMLRRWLGTEGASYIFYDDPALVEEMLDFLTEYAIALLDRALKEVDIDYFGYHEDMAFKTGPLLSPEMTRKYFLPRYRRINDHLRKRGVDLIMMDSDGDIRKLIPIFLESGIDGVWPLEAAAGMNPVELRKEYGKELVMAGGIDKRELTKGKIDIERELYAKAAPIVSQGGYIPIVDHTVPPDVSLENFLYYLEVKERILSGKG